MRLLIIFLLASFAAHATPGLDTIPKGRFQVRKGAYVYRELAIDSPATVGSPTNMATVLPNGKIGVASVPSGGNGPDSVARVLDTVFNKRSGVTVSKFPLPLVGLSVQDRVTTAGTGTVANPWRAADSAAGIQTLVDTAKVVRLSEGIYRNRKPIDINNTNGGIKTANITGQSDFIMYPNAEGLVQTGTVIKPDTSGFRIGTTDQTNEPRPGRPSLEKLAIVGPGRSLISGYGSNYHGAGIIYRGSSDQAQIQRVTITNSVYGIAVRSSAVVDAATFSRMSIIGNRYPMVVDSLATTTLYTTLDNSIIADNYGPMILGNGMQLTNNIVASNGYQDLHTENGIYPANVYIPSNMHDGKIMGGYYTNPGLSNLLQTRIAADGIVVAGDNWQIIGATIAGANQTGKAGIRVKGTAANTVINSTFRVLSAGGYFPNNATDVIIESGATNTTLYLYPGMTYTDNGTGTVIIPGAGAGAAIPANQLAIGNGTGITSDPNFAALNNSGSAGLYLGTLGSSTVNTIVHMSYPATTGGSVIDFYSGATKHFEFGQNDANTLGDGGSQFYLYHNPTSRYRMLVTPVHFNIMRNNSDFALSSDTAGNVEIKKLYLPQAGVNNAADTLYGKDPSTGAVAKVAKSSITSGTGPNGAFAYFNSAGKTTGNNNVGYVDTTNSTLHMKSASSSVNPGFEANNDGSGATSMFTGGTASAQAGYGGWYTNQSNGYTWLNSGGSQMARLYQNGTFRLNGYGTGAKTGTLAYATGFDASGNLIEYTPSSSGTDTADIAGSNIAISRSGSPARRTFSVVTSPAFTGTPTSPNPAATDSSTQIETTAGMRQYLESRVLARATTTGQTAGWNGSPYNAPSDGVVRVVNFSLNITITTAAVGGAVTPTLDYYDETNTRRQIALAPNGSTTTGLTATGKYLYAVIGEINIYPGTHAEVTVTLGGGTATYSASASFIRVR